MTMHRMLYHDEFCLFMQEGCCKSSESCTPKRVGCLIKRSVANRLRTHLSKLMDNKYDECKHTSKQKCGCKRMVINGDGDYANWWKVNLFESEVVYKKRIYHVKEVARKTTIDIKPTDIQILGNNNITYDPLKYELAILEEDLFNLAVCVSLGRTVMQTIMQYYRNISVEMKPKCGILNFSGFPSLFQMCQPYKARIRYENIVSSQCPESTDWIINERAQENYNSGYSPIKLFGMELADVKKELQCLAKVPQNNIRIFINNVEVDPAILIQDQCAMDNVARCLVENKVIMNRILKLQALASGQQIVASVLYLLCNMVYRFFNAKEKIRDKVQKKWEVSSITQNLMALSKELLAHVLCQHANPYRIQRMFNIIGRKLICSMCNVLKMLLDNKTKHFCFSKRNICLYRMTGVNDKRNCIQSPDTQLTIHSQGRLLRNVGANDEAVQLVLYKELETILSRINVHVANQYFNRKHYSARKKTSCSSESPKCSMAGRNPISNHHSWKRCKMLLDHIEQWINLYLGGRTAMDLSVVLNVLFHTGSKGERAGPNFFRFSLIDLDLKPVHRIPRWKEDVLFLVNKQISTA
uniref:Inositol-pentakisphosphate 2-kinase n=2 Tax=Babesia bovis TaxID=5865 RepID=A7AMC2_BABBO|eukprot:XP_001611274.1 hypothetical protein [Babesia bovis T2Bo]